MIKLERILAISMFGFAIFVAEMMHISDTAAAPKKFRGRVGIVATAGVRNADSATVVMRITNHSASFAVVRLPLLCSYRFTGTREQNPAEAATSTGGELVDSARIFTGNFSCGPWLASCYTDDAITIPSGQTLRVEERIPRAVDSPISWPSDDIEFTFTLAPGSIACATACDVDRELKVKFPALSHPVK